MITREEYELLKSYRDKGYSYLARDKDNLLCVNMYNPRKLNDRWSWGTNDLLLNGDNLKCVRWEDEKPTKIDDLIRDYESHQAIVGERVKVTVPQYVADWIEEVKGLKRNFKLEYLFDTTEMPDDVFDWLDERYGDTDILAKAWMDGFVVEKEKLYTVELPNHQRLAKIDDDIKFYDEREWFEKNLNTKLTRAEIESVDPILMGCAVEVE